MTMTATPPKMTTTKGSTTGGECTLAPSERRLELLPGVRAGARGADRRPRPRTPRVHARALRLLREPGGHDDGLRAGRPRLPHPPAGQGAAASSLGPAGRLRRGRRAPDRDGPPRGLRGDRAGGPAPPAHRRL